MTEFEGSFAQCDIATAHNNLSEEATKNIVV